MKHASKPKPTPAQITAAEPQPETDSVVKKPHSEKPSYLRELTDMQLQACELAADLIMNGGHHDDVSGLLYNLVAHSWRRRFPDYPADPEERSKNAEKYGDQFWPNWYDKLARNWPEPAVRPKRPKPTTVVEMARENTRKRGFQSPSKPGAVIGLAVTRLSGCGSAL